MAFRQLFKCISCTSKNESTTDEIFSYSAVNELSQIDFDHDDNEELNTQINERLPGLTKQEANEALAEIWNKYVNLKRTTYEKDLNLRTLTDTNSGEVFRWSQSTNDGNGPESGRSLWILMYGNETSPNEIDVKLKDDEGSIWLIPRCSSIDCQDEYIDKILDQLIEHHIIVNEVNPNRIFLIGISSSGGDHVFQLASRMADRWSAAGVMNGHSNNISPLSFRNLPFVLFILRENKRDNKKLLEARKWGQLLEEYSKEDFMGSGYHYWMRIGNIKVEKQDALKWMNKYTRNPWPTRIIWHQQGPVLKKRFYWLSLPFPEQMKKEQTIIVEVNNRKSIYLEQIPDDVKALVIRLSDKLVNLNQPITVNIKTESNVMKIFHGFVPRTRLAIEQSIEERADPMSVATALFHVIWDSNTSIISCHSSVDIESTCPICSIQTKF